MLAVCDEMGPRSVITAVQSLFWIGVTGAMSVYRHGPPIAGEVGVGEEHQSAELPPYGRYHSVDTGWTGTMSCMTSISRAVSILAVWGAATMFGLAFAELTRVGPVLLTLTRGHGIHAGDLLAFAAAYSVAAVLTRYLLRGSGVSSLR